MAPDPDNIYLLDKKSTKRIPYIVRTILYYSRSVDPTILLSVNEISQVQSKPTRDTKKKERMLLYYAATYPNAIIHYKASNMFLHLESDAAYLTMPEAIICYESYFYLSDWPSLSPINPNPKRNIPIRTECKKILNVVSSASETEPLTIGKQLSACYLP